jgi:hypothetical protein
MIMEVFWDTRPCSVVEARRRFSGVCTASNKAMIALMMVAVRTSERTIGE